MDTGNACMHEDEEVHGSAYAVCDNNSVQHDDDDHDEGYVPLKDEDSHSSALVEQML